MPEQYFLLEDQSTEAQSILEPFAAQALIRGYLECRPTFIMGRSRDALYLSDKAKQEGYETPKRLLEVWLYRKKKELNDRNGNV